MAGVAGGAGLVLDPLWRRLAAGLADRRWLAPPVDPRGVLGVATGLLAVLLVLTAASAWLALPLVALAPIVTVATAVDVRVHRLPDRLTAGGAGLLAVLVVVAAIGAGDGAVVWHAAAGAAVLAGFLLVVHLVNPAGMGFGDVKFGVPLGLAVGTTGLGAVVAALLAGTLLGALAGVTVLARHRDRHRAFAFGPWLAAGAVVVLVLSG